MNILSAYFATQSTENTEERIALPLCTLWPINPGVA